METTDPPLYRVPDDIAWIDGTEIGLGEELYLARLPTGETLLLKDTARMVWHQAVSDPQVGERVAELVGRSPAEIHGEIDGFVQRLIDAGLLATRKPMPRKRS